MIFDDQIVFGRQFTATTGPRSLDAYGYGLGPAVVKATERDQHREEEEEKGGSQQEEEEGE